jgi:hypothetical protein
MSQTRKTIALAPLVALLEVFPAMAQEIPPPPWLMTGTHGIEVGYALDEKTVRGLLPKGVEPVKELSGGFELYTSPGGYGITPYSAFNVFVDVEGMDMPDGRKGRWMLMGLYGPSEAVAAALRQYHAWPVQAGSARVERNAAGEWVWIGSANGRDFIEVRVRRKADACEMHSALDHWSGKAASGPVLITRIPNTYCWRDVEVAGVAVSATPGSAFAKLQPGNKPISYAVEWENGAWAFTTPIPRR